MFFLLLLLFSCYVRTNTQKFWGSSFSSFWGLRVFVLKVFVFETPLSNACLMALAPTSLLWLSGRASKLVLVRS